MITKVTFLSNFTNIIILNGITSNNEVIEVIKEKHKEDEQEVCKYLLKFRQAIA